MCIAETEIKRLREREVKRERERKKNRSIKLSKLILKLDFGKQTPNLAGCLFLAASKPTAAK